MSDRLGPRRMVAAGGLLFGLIAFALGADVKPAGAIGLFLALGLVAGLTESGERAVVAELAPVRTGRGFGAYHAAVGAAALPAGLIFGTLYQTASGRMALWASAVGMAAAVVVWLIFSPGRRRSGPAKGSGSWLEELEPRSPSPGRGQVTPTPSQPYLSPGRVYISAACWNDAFAFA